MEKSRYIAIEGPLGVGKSSLADLLAKDRICAYLNLDENELGLYEQVYRLLDTRIPKPDLVIYLQASTDVLFDRIRKRSIDHERHIKEDYLDRLVEGENRYFFYYTRTPLCA